MKNYFTTKLLSILFATMMTGSAFAQQSFLPSVPMIDDETFRLQVGGAGSYVSKQDYSVGAAVSSIWALTEDFYLGASMNFIPQGELFTKDSTIAYPLTASVSPRYLTEFLDDFFYTGIEATVGYTHRFDGDNVKELGKFYALASLPLSFQVFDEVFFYLTPGLAVREIGKNAEDKMDAQVGFAVPVGLSSTIGETSIFAQYTVNSKAFKDVSENYSSEFAIGVSMPFGE